jgi:hypothetical protein
MISKVSLGSLLDLFLTVDEFDVRYDFGEQFRAVEPAPVFLGFLAQFKDHWVKFQQRYEKRHGRLPNLFGAC